MRTKLLFNYIIILSLSLVVFGCGGPTIDKDSEEYDYIERNRKKITTYKGVPFSGTVVKYYKNGQLETKKTYKEGKEDERKNVNGVVCSCCLIL